MEDIDAYKCVFSRPGRFTAAINYYRAMFLCPVKPIPDAKLQVPTLVIWVIIKNFIYEKNVLYQLFTPDHYACLINILKC